jgi:hypothetical protein
MQNNGLDGIGKLPVTRDESRVLAVEAIADFQGGPKRWRLETHGRRLMDVEGGA